MKKILIFSIAYHPFVGGAEIAVKEITDRISPSDIEFDMITLRFDKAMPKFEKIGNVNVYRIGFTKNKPSMGDLIRFPMYLNKIFFPVTAFLKALSLHKKRKYDNTWCIMSYMGFPALFLKWFKNVPMILTLQEGDSIDHVIGRKRIKIVFPFYQAIFINAALVQVISNFLGKFARDMGYVGRVEVIPNGVDTTLFTKEYSSGELDTLKQKLGKKPGDVFLITTSRLVPKNGTEDVIRALPHLPENVKFLILGDGPLESHLKKTAGELGLSESNRVIFHSFVPHPDLPKYLKISDIFIRPSLSEGMGNSFIEAMAAGIPVIATPVGGIVDFLKDGQTGLLCEVNDPESIASKVKEFLNHPEKEKIVANARELALKNYNWDLIAKNIVNKIFKN